MPAPVAPEVYERVNRDSRRGRSVIELNAGATSHPASLRLTSDSLHWREDGTERRLAVRELDFIRISGRSPTFGDRVASGFLSALIAGAALTTYFALTEEGGGALGIAGGMMINTVLAAPLAWPVGFLAAPFFERDRTYDFRAAPEPLPSPR